MLSTPSPRSRTLVFTVISVAVALFLFDTASQPELRPACQVETLGATVKGVVQGVLAVLPEEYEIGDKVLKTIDTVPILQGAVGPKGCLQECLAARTRLEHCVVQRQYSLRSAVVTGLRGSQVDALEMQSACHFWDSFVGDGSVNVSAKFVLSIPQKIAFRGDIVEKSRCLVGDIPADGSHDLLTDATPPEERTWLRAASSHKSLISIAGVRLRVESTLLVDECTITAADVSHLSVQIDKVDSELAALDAAADFVVDSDWAQPWLSSVGREKASNAIAKALPKGMEC